MPKIKAISLRLKIVFLSTINGSYTVSSDNLPRQCSPMDDEYSFL